MSTDMLANAVTATTMAIMLLVAGISIALANDLQPQTYRGAADVSNRPVSERGIDAIGSKEDTSSASTSEKVLYKYKYENKYGRGDYKYDEVRQPLPPKDTKGPVKKDVGEAVGLNPQPLPPAGGMVK